MNSDDYNEGNAPLAIYSDNKAFQMNCKDKYHIDDPNLLYNDTLLLLLYAYEWFDISSDDPFSKVSYHPYLTIKHYDRLHRIYQSQLLNHALLAIPVFIGFSIFNKNLNQRKSYVRHFKNAIFTIGLISPVWPLYFKPRMQQHIREDKELSRYVNIDIDREKIKEQINNLGVTLV